jgi:hypothetical protein
VRQLRRTPSPRWSSRSGSHRNGRRARPACRGRGASSSSPARPPHERVQQPAEAGLERLGVEDGEAARTV